MHLAALQSLCYGDPAQSSVECPPASLGTIGASGLVEAGCVCQHRFVMWGGAALGADA